MISCVLKSSVLTCKRVHKKVIKRWLILILFRFVTTIIPFLKLKVINRNLRISDRYVSVTTDSLRYVANLRFPYTVAQSQWLSKLPITLLWLHGKQAFLYVKVTALHYVLWDPLLLDFPILATCSQVVIKELNHWANQPTLFSRTTLKGWFITKIGLDDDPKCLYDCEKGRGLKNVWL